MRFQVAIYGDVSVKFRAMGVDFGTVRRAISLDDAVKVDVPFGLPAALPIRFQRFGIGLDLWVVPA